MKTKTKFKVSVKSRRTDLRDEKKKKRRGRLFHTQKKKKKKELGKKLQIEVLFLVKTPWKKRG